eukprot:1109319-Pyramimonas_sp.AAC.1
MALAAAVQRHLLRGHPPGVRAHPPARPGRAAGAAHRARPPTGPRQDEGESGHGRGHAIAHGFRAPARRGPPRALRPLPH